jgi:hypothetical protein
MRCKSFVVFRCLFSLSGLTYVVIMLKPLGGTFWLNNVLRREDTAT